MLRDDGTARVSVVPNPAAPHEDLFLKAVQGAAAEDFTVLGEIGRGKDGVIIYLAREVSSTRLVALRLQREGQLADEFSLEVARHLDNSMPAPESKCFKCGKAIRGWARFCGYCGADLSGAAPAEDDTGGHATMLAALNEAVAADYEVLGEMSRSEGGGAVYFARDRETNRIVALRLQREGAGDEFSVGLTSALKPLAASLGVKPVATQVLGALVSPPSPSVPMASPPAPPAATPRQSAVPPPPALVRRTMTRRTKLLVAGIAAVVLVLAIVVATLPEQQAPSPPGLRTSGRDSALTTAAAPPPAPPPAKPPAVPPAAPVLSRSAAAPVPMRERPKDATIVVSGLPVGADVRVDGHPRVGRSLTVAPGSHTLSVAVSGYLPRTDTMQLRPGETVAWSPVLTGAAAKPPTPKAAPPPAAPPRTAAEQSPKGGTAGGPACQADVDAKKWSDAFEACMREALAGSAAAKRNVAELYDRGHGVVRSDENATRWYDGAAAAGDHESMYQLAMAYERGRGINKDQTAAARWYARAADAGHPLAQYAIGEAYEKARLGLPKNKAKALEWYRMAAAQGNKAAANKVHDLSK